MERKTNGQGNLRVSKQTMVSPSSLSWSLPSPFGRSIFAWLTWKKGFVGKSKFQGTNEQPPNIRFVLIPCRNAPAKRQKRPVGSVLVLYFSGCAVVVPDWSCAWFLHLAEFPALFRGFISLHLKVSPKPGWVHSPNQLITAECHIHHSKLQDLWEWILSFWRQKHLQTHKQDSLPMIQTYFS